MATILVIDDVPEMRSYLQEILERAGYSVTTAANGNEGIRLYKQNPTDIVITDLLMPEKDGVEMVLDLRKDYPEVKIIVVTGGGNIHGMDLLDLIDFLPVDYSCTKPIDKKKLLMAIDTLLYSHPQL